MKLGFSKKNYISLILFFGIFIASILFIILPLIKGIKEISQQILLEEEARLAFSEEMKNFQNFRTVYQEINPDLEETENLFIVPEPPIEFINFLEKTASDYNVFIEISSVTPGKTEENPWPFLDFRLQASGSFSSFFRFIEKLENSSYLIEIYELNLRGLIEGGLGSEESVKPSAGDISASFSLKVFTK